LIFELYYPYNFFIRFQEFLQGFRTGLIDEYELETERIAPQRLLGKTGMHMLDILFEYFAQICHDEKIEFTLNIWGDMPNDIPARHLEILVSNHATNALESIKEAKKETPSKSPHRLVITIGKRSHANPFVLSIFDSGIPFSSPQTLAQLGETPTTTKNNPEGGIGFMESFKYQNRTPNITKHNRERASHKQQFHQGHNFHIRLPQSI